MLARHPQSSRDQKQQRSADGGLGGGPHEVGARWTVARSDFGPWTRWTGCSEAEREPAAALLRLRRATLVHTKEYTKSKDAHTRDRDRRSPTRTQEIRNKSE